MKKAIFLFCLLLLSTLSFAQTTPDEFSAEFFNKYKQSIDDAVDFMFHSNEFLSDAEENVAKIKSSLNYLSGLLGKFDGYEKISEASVGKSLIVQIYMVKYESLPLRFIFKYYKPRDKWILYTFSFNDDIDEDIGEAVKYDLTRGK